MANGDGGGAGLPPPPQALRRLKPQIEIKNQISSFITPPKNRIGIAARPLRAELTLQSCPRWSRCRSVSVRSIILAGQIRAPPHRVTGCLRTPFYGRCCDRRKLLTQQRHGIRRNGRSNDVEVSGAVAFIDVTLSEVGSA